MRIRKKSSKASTQKRATQRAKKRGVVRQVQDMVLREIRNLSTQLQAAIALNTYMASGKRMGAMQGWPVSPDLGLLLVDLIESRDYQAVVEFGSGTSTMLLALACRNRKARDGVAIKQLAFEHLPEFCDQTRDLLYANQLHDGVELVLAPLASVEIAGASFEYYQCDAALASLASELGRASRLLRILVLVDGPPGATNPMARYPALYFLLKHFSKAGLDLLLDDTIRADEQTIITRWKKELTALGRIFSEHKYPFEKGACLLRVEPTG